MRRTVALACATALVLVLLTGRAAAGPRGVTVPEDRRTLIISVPGLTWEDVNDRPVPNLRDLLDQSAVANVSLRIAKLATEPGEGYATLGAGTRAVAPAGIAGMSYGREEPFGSATAGDEFARQAGHSTTADVVGLTFARLVGQNDSSDYEATIGLLGETLADAGIQRGVVANADAGDALAPLEPPHREAALAMADADGEVPCGDVDRSLLVEDANGPFGIALDQAAVEEAVARCSTAASVVLVEASDLRRTALYGQRLSDAARSAARDRALRATDSLVAALAARLDPARDALVILAPALVDKEPRLAVLGIRAAEMEPGLLVSGSTRQPGFVTLADVMPSIAELAGAPFDDGAIEGRAVESVDGPGSAADRRQRLEDADAAARFRDQMLTPVAAIFITGVCLLGLGAGAVLWRQGRLGARFEYGAMVLLAIPVLTYLAALLPFHDWGAGPYVLFVFGGGALLGAGYWALRSSWLRPLAVAFGVLVIVLATSVVLLGSRLQLSTVFGDSPIIAGRFNGINNITFALLMIAAIALAIIAVRTWPGRRGELAMLGILGGVLLIDVAPMWGADVGGILAGMPALAVVAVGLARRRIRWRTIAVVGAGVAVVLVLLGILDLSRDEASRSHLGRLFERIGSEGIDGLLTVVERKLGQNLRSLGNSVWRFILIPVLLGVTVVILKAPGRLHTLDERMPELRRVLPGLGVAAFLGFALNDSGIAVPGMMLAALVPAVVYLLARTGEEPSA